MKTNVAIDLTDAERAHLSNIFHNKTTKSMISRKELNDLIGLMVTDLLALDVGTPKEVVTNKISKEGFTHKFNGVDVSKEVYEGGIKKWLGLEED
tara:strand:- start:81 stop:365 length:285 start_codon:yes stop_codon:yes gene_type:complete